MSLAAVVMAAGEGKRLHTRRAKVLHEAGGRALIDWVLGAIEPLDVRPVVVVIGHLREQVATHLAGRGMITAVQDPPRGTGDAVMQALPYLPESGEALVVSGDTPLLTTGSLKALLAARRRASAALAVATAVLPDAGAYGRILRDTGGDVVGIVEARDATPEQRLIGEVNVGAYAFDLPSLRPLLAALSPDNAQGEYYLTDVIGHAVRHGWRAVASVFADPSEMTGVNTRAELAAVHRTLNARMLGELMTSGVTVLDPATTWVEATCTVGRDSVLEPGVHLRQGCRVGEGCRIGAHAVLDGVTVPDGGVIAPLARVVGGLGPADHAAGTVPLARAKD
ncbi:MAG TPA: NTP transferase domain-containing protein [Thermoanaerobaculaceae bacterium]|nr:NTP transferase domain-containing protein [Thermoanaerobaculaceae bacterium]HPS77392.1 NTP transferase domain-containing protein [Thermoanaerobaculaceae bacterium]